MIQKGRGVFCVQVDQLHRRVRTLNDIKYMKCTVIGCDDSAKIDNDQFVLLVNRCFVHYKLSAGCRFHRTVSRISSGTRQSALTISDVC